MPPTRPGRARWWAPIALGGSFLTVLPVPRVEASPRALAKAIALFPVVGAGLGALLGAVGLAFDGVLPPGPVALLLLAASVVLTGGLHLDGLMDTADGVFGGRTIERRLEIMRDSRIGSFGVVAGALVLIGQYACLAELIGTGRLTALVVAFGLSRWVLAVALGVFPPARSTGLGATFREAGGRGPLAVATLVAAGVALAAGALGVVAFVVAAAVALLGGRFLAKHLGGLTGDTYGALGAIAETLVLYVAVAFRSV